MEERTMSSGMKQAYQNPTAMRTASRLYMTVDVPVSVCVRYSQQNTMIDNGTSVTRDLHCTYIKLPTKMH